MSRENFGWSYPPGVTEGMIPGCRREDEEIDFDITLTLGEIEEMDQTGTIPEDTVQRLYDQFMQGWPRRQDRTKEER